jgi:hypothetical protein
VLPTRKTASHIIFAKGLRALGISGHVVKPQAVQPPRTFIASQALPLRAVLAAHCGPIKDGPCASPSPTTMRSSISAGC